MFSQSNGFANILIIFNKIEECTLLKTSPTGVEMYDICDRKVCIEQSKQITVTMKTAEISHVPSQTI